MENMHTDVGVKRLNSRLNKKRNENKAKTKINKLNKKSGDGYTIRKNIFFLNRCECGEY